MFSSFPGKSARPPGHACPALVLALLIAVTARAEIVVGESFATAGTPGLVGVFARTDEFVVLRNSFGGGTPEVLVFPRLAQGNVAPSRIISGANTGFAGAQGFGIMAADLDSIFANGFEVGP